MIGPISKKCSPNSGDVAGKASRVAAPSLTQFQISAALWVIRAVDMHGTDHAALNGAFRTAVTHGRFPRPDLDNAFALLAERGLLLAANGRVSHHESLSGLLSLSDSVALSLLARLLATPAELEDDFGDAARREATGALGEEAVVKWCVDELLALGRGELAEQVKRVSAVSDRFGYDVSAPSIRAAPRMLEVKTTTTGAGKTFRFYLTRNEYEIGRRHSQQWSMVACVSDGEEATIVGWCRASEFARYLPDDGNGRWTEALVNLPSIALLSGLPSAVE